jgi:hypothetical protein
MLAGMVLLVRNLFLPTTRWRRVVRHVLLTVALLPIALVIVFFIALLTSDDAGW